MNKREELKAMLTAVDELAAKMKAKLRAKARQGYEGGLDPDYRDAVEKKLHQHVRELSGYCDACGGHSEDDPQDSARQAVDVANLAMMLWVQGGKP